MAEWQQPQARLATGQEIHAPSRGVPEYGTILEGYHEKEYVPWLFQFITAIARSVALLVLVGKLKQNVKKRPLLCDKGDVCCKNMRF